MEGQDSEYNSVIRSLIATTSATVTLNRDIDAFYGRSPSSSTQQPQSRTVTPLNDSRMIRIPEFQEFAKLFECPVCYDIIVPPINSCRNGHLLCFNCRRNVGLCPLCRAPFSEHRNIFAEQISAICVVICKHREAGCNAMFLGDELMGHEYFCDFRPIRCPDCEKHVEYHKFIDHLELEGVPVSVGSECHTGYEITGNEPTGGEQAWEPTWIKAYDTNFFAMLESSNSIWYFTVACFGTVTEAAQFRCEITLWNKDKGMDVKYSGPVYSLRVGTREAVHRGECLSVDKKVLDAYNRHGGVDVIIKIFRRSTYVSRLINPEDNNESQQMTVSAPASPSTAAAESSASSLEESQSPGIPDSQDLDIIVEVETEIAELETGLANVNIDVNTRSLQSLRVARNKNGRRHSSRNVEQGSPVSLGSESASTSAISNMNFEREIQPIERRRRRSSFPVEVNNNLSPDSARRHPSRYSADSLESFTM